MLHSVTKSVEVAERQVGRQTSVNRGSRQINHVEVQLDAMTHSADHRPLTENWLNRQAEWKPRRTEVTGAYVHVKTFCSYSTNTKHCNQTVNDGDQLTTEFNKLLSFS